MTNNENSKLHSEDTRTINERCHNTADAAQSAQGWKRRCGQLNP
jgi:hypothetical protein